MSIITISKYLYIISFIIWLLPPLRQFKGKYFLYFLILALNDPLSYVYTYVIMKGSSNLWIIILSYYFLIISITERDVLKKNMYVFMVILVFLIVVSILNLAPNYYFTIIVLEHSIILLIFLRIFITNYVNYRKINLFTLLLIIYELMFTLKFFNFIIGFADAVAFFIITSFAQIALGFFFSIFREDNPRLLVQL